MDIVVIAIALIAAFVLPRAKALPVALAGWVFGMAMVAWGPAHNSHVHLNSIGFWGPWAILLVLTMLVVFGIDALKRRWARPRTA